MVLAQFSALRALWRHGDGAACSRPASPGHEACGKPSAGVGVDGDPWSWLDLAGERRGRMSAQFSALRALWRHGDGAASSRPASPGHEACGKPPAGVGVDGDQWS